MLLVQPQHVRAGDDRQSCFADIHCGVDVSVVRRAAFRARPGACRQIERFERVPTARTAFAARVEAVDLDERAPVPLRLVLGCCRFVLV